MKQVSEISRQLDKADAQSKQVARRKLTQSLPPKGPARDRVLIEMTLQAFTPEERQLILDSATIRRIECPDGVSRIRRAFQAGESQPLSDAARQDLAARKRYFFDWAVSALAGFPEELAARIVQEAPMG